MIGIIFDFAGEVVEVRIEGRTLYFRNSPRGGYAVIEQLNLSKPGVEKEFPDLVGNANWRVEAIKRLKERLKLFNTEMEVYDYVILELMKFGYKPIIKQRQGFRPQRI